MALSASIFQNLSLLDHVKVNRGLILLLLPLLLPSLPFFLLDLLISHKLLGVFTINLVCSHFHLIAKLGKALEGVHFCHAKNFLEEVINESSKKMNLFFYFYSSIWNLNFLSESDVLKVLVQSFDWFNVARFKPFLVNRNNAVWRVL